MFCDLVIGTGDGQVRGGNFMNRERVLLLQFDWLTFRIIFCLGLSNKLAPVSTGRCAYVRTCSVWMCKLFHRFHELQVLSSKQSLNLLLNLALGVYN